MRHGRAGSTVKSSASGRPCGGRPTAAESPTTGSTKSRCSTYHLQVDQTQIQSKRRSRRIRRPARRIPIVDLFVYDVASKKTHKGRRSRRQALRQRRRRPLRLSHRVVGGRHRSCSSTGRTGGRTSSEFAAANPRDRRGPRDRPRGMADGLDREQPVDDVSQRQPSLHLGIAAQRLEQLLSLRSRRQADRAADLAHQLRSRHRS